MLTCEKSLREGGQKKLSEFSYCKTMPRASLASALRHCSIGSFSLHSLPCFPFHGLEFKHAQVFHELEKSTPNKVTRSPATSDSHCLEHGGALDHPGAKPEPLPFSDACAKEVGTGLLHVRLGGSIY